MKLTPDGVIKLVDFGLVQVMPRRRAAYDHRGAGCGGRRLHPAGTVSAGDLGTRRSTQRSVCVRCDALSPADQHAAPRSPRAISGIRARCAIHAISTRPCGTGRRARCCGRWPCTRMIARRMSGRLPTSCSAAERCPFTGCPRCAARRILGSTTRCRSHAGQSCTGGADRGPARAGAAGDDLCAGDLEGVMHSGCRY